jgi:hypothetical protein
MFDFSYPNKDNSARGWGPGWPADRHAEMVPLAVHGKTFVGGVQPALVDLLTMLLEEVEGRGYTLHLPGCYGYAGRYTKRSDGTQTTTPSNHSWGTAVDINAPQNVFGGGHDMPQWVADLMKEYGFRWLGPAIGDWMHFDFAGSPADAKAMTAMARKDGIGMALTDEQAQTLKRAEVFLDALMKAGDFNTADGAGTKVGKAVKDGTPSAPPALVPHRHKEGTTGPAVAED